MLERGVPRVNAGGGLPAQAADVRCNRTGPTSREARAGGGCGGPKRSEGQSGHARPRRLKYYWHNQGALEGNVLRRGWRTGCGAKRKQHV